MTPIALCGKRREEGREEGLKWTIRQSYSCVTVAKTTAFSNTLKYMHIKSFSRCLLWTTSCRQNVDSIAVL